MTEDRPGLTILARGKEFVWAWSLVLGREPLNPCTSQSEDSVSAVIHGGSLRPHRVVYAKVTQKGAGDIRKTNHQ